MERALVRANVDEPQVLTDYEIRRLRYLISFARLTVFEPGAAGEGRRSGRGEVDLTAELAPLRERVVARLRGPLRTETEPSRRLLASREAYYELEQLLDEGRRDVIRRHSSRFSAAELDAEVGVKNLVLVLGGGGGAGFVYLGAYRALADAGLLPDYLMGSSIGAVLGAVLSRELPVPTGEYVEFARSLTYRSLLGPEPPRRHGLAGLMSLRFDEFAGPIFERDDGRQMRLHETVIPFDVVVAGVHRQLFSRLPSSFRRRDLARLQLDNLPVRPSGLGPQAVGRLWQVASFIDTRMVKPIVLGGDDLTRQLNVVDAASFSAAIPGVLHHETKDPAMVPILDELMATRDVAALVDGFAASNVPAEQAWIMVQRGRLGSRNAAFLALDCFHPQLDPRHLWLTPITRAVSLQMVRNLPYCDHLLQMSPTLSPLNLAPSDAALDRALTWGSESMTAALPFVTAMTETVWWEGERPSSDRERPTGHGRLRAMRTLLGDRFRTGLAAPSHSAPARERETSGRSSRAGRRRAGARAARTRPGGIAPCGRSSWPSPDR
ncbi:patatin-like phospholipase family protein [Nocardioides humilatus]|nr:patatin-like phospholipase family protein [Nocardioides humilatus]